MLWQVLMLGGLMLTSWAFTGDESVFAKTQAELNETEPEFIDCVTSGGDCLLFDFISDTISLFTFGGLGLEPIARIFLIILVLVPIGFLVAEALL